MPANSTDSEARVFPSLVRPILIAGIERVVVIPLVGLVTALLFGYDLNWLTPTLALTVVFVLFPILRRINKQDPKAWRVFRDHVRISGFYLPQAAYNRPRRRPHHKK